MDSDHSAPPGWIGHVAFSHKDMIYLWGGYKESRHVETVFFPPLELTGYWIKHGKWFTFKCSGDNGGSTTGSTSAIVGDYMYLYGGYSQNPRLTWLSDLYRLCLDSFTWEHIMPEGIAPYPVDKTVSWSYNGKFFIFGGFGNILMAKCDITTSPFECTFDNDAGKAWINQFYQYNPATNKWSIPDFQGTLPMARAAHAATVVQDQVYIFGGRRANRRMNDLHRLDLKTMTWSGPLSINGPLPEGRSWHSLTAISDNLILLYGGFSNKNRVLSDAWFFVVNSTIWQRIEHIHGMPRLWHTATLLPNGKVMVAGGCEFNIFSTARKKEADTIFLRMSPKSLLSLCCDLINQDKRLEHQRIHVQRTLKLLGIEETNPAISGNTEAYSLNLADTSSDDSEID